MLPGIPEGIGIPVAVEKDGFRRVTAAVTVIAGRSTPITLSLSHTYLELLSFHGGWYIAGTDGEIRWEAGGIRTIRIEFSPNGGRGWLLLADKVDARRGSWTWTVPDMPSRNGLVRITASDRPELTDRSEHPFLITSI
jgi:hypothetical protein